MKNHFVLLGCLAAAAIAAPNGFGQSISSSYADLEYLYVTPQSESATVVFNGWNLLASSQSDNNTPASDVQFGMGNDTIIDIWSSVPFHDGEVYLDATFPDDPWGQTAQFAGSFDPAAYGASGDSAGSFTGSFRITGGEGTVAVDIDAQFLGGAIAASAGAGYSANSFGLAHVYFGESHMGTVLWSAAAANGSFAFNENDEEQWVSFTQNLAYGTDYTLTIQLDSAAFAFGDGSIPTEPVPEPATIFGAAALALAAFRRVRKN